MSILDQLLNDNSGERLLRTALEGAKAEQRAKAKMQEQQVKKLMKMQNDNYKLLADDKKLDAKVAAAYAEIAPSLKKAKNSSKYQTKTAALDASTPDDHPQKGRAEMFKTAFRDALQSEIGAVIPAGDILQNLKAQETEGIKEAAYQYKRQADTGIFELIPFVDNEAESIRKLPGYEDWLAQKKIEENRRFAEEQGITDPGKWLEDLTIAAGIGAVAGGTVGAIGPGMASAATLGAAGAAAGFAVGGPIGAAVGLVGGAAMGIGGSTATGVVAGALTGAGSFALFEAGAKPARAYLAASEWYNANMDGDFWDKAKVIAADFGISTAGGMAAMKAHKALKNVGATIKNLKAGETVIPQIEYKPRRPNAQGTLHEQSEGTIYQGYKAKAPVSNPLIDYKPKPNNAQGILHAQSGEPIHLGDTKQLTGTMPKRRQVTYNEVGEPINLPNYFDDSVIRLGADELRPVLRPGVRVGRNAPGRSIEAGYDVTKPPVHQGYMPKDIVVRDPEIALFRDFNNFVKHFATETKTTVRNAGMYYPAKKGALQTLYEPPRKIAGRVLPQEERAILMLEPPPNVIPEKVATRIFTGMTKADQEKVLNLAMHPQIGSMEMAVKDVKQAQAMMKNIEALESVNYSPVAKTFPKVKALATTEHEAFAAAYNKVGKGSDFVDIYKVRRELGWNKEKFNKVLDDMWLSDQVVLNPGHTGKYSKKQIAESFVDAEKEQYLSMTWKNEGTPVRGGRAKVTVPKFKNKLKDIYDPPRNLTRENAMSLYSQLDDAAKREVQEMARTSEYAGDLTKAMEAYVNIGYGATRHANMQAESSYTSGVLNKIRAGKKVHSVDIYRSILEATDPLEITALQATGKLSPRHFEILQAKEVKRLTNKETKRVLKRLGYDLDKFVGLSVGGIGIMALAELFSPEEAEAGIFSNAASTIPKMFANGAKKAMREGKLAEYTKSMRNLKQAVVFSENAREMPKQFQMQFNVAQYAKEHYGSLFASLENVKGMTRSAAGKLMSPGFYGDFLQKTKGRVAIQMASAEAAIAANTGAVQKVFNSIIERVDGVRGNTGKILKEMEPLAKRMPDEVGVYAKIANRIKTIENSVEGVEEILKTVKGKAKYNTIKAKLDVVKGDEYQRLLNERTRYKEKYLAFVKDLEAKHKELAQKYPSVRLALAAEKDTKSNLYPWLDGMMTAEEKEATAYIKNIFNTYRERMKDLGHSTIDSKPFVHHPIHPSIATDRVAVEKLAELGIIPRETLPFTKFFHRSLASKQLVPDIEYIMAKYIPDTEKRIQWSAFWKEWKDHADAAKQLPGHGDFWRGVEKAIKPVEAIPLHQWANRYYQFEVIRLIGGSVSAAYKHLFKLTGTVANFGTKHTFKVSPEAFMQGNRLAKEYLSNTAIGRRFGWRPKQNKTATDELVDAYLAVSRHTQTFAEMHLDAGMESTYKSLVTQKVDSILKKAADASTLPIKYIEWVDRAHSVLAIRDLALSKEAGTVFKEGMTAADASYQTWDTIIKMNFMGGSLNASWQRNPAVRTALMFQNTPAKIMERRLVNALKTKDAVVKTGKYVFDTYQKKVDALNELQGLMRYIKAGEQAFKGGLYGEAAKVMNSITTASGQPYYQQFLRDVLISGIIIVGGGQIYDADLKSHVFHFPFLRANTETPVLSVAPIIAGAYRTLEEQGEDDDDMLMVRFGRNWLGNHGVIPQTIWKGMRLNNNDIPDAYNNSWLKYLFSVPAVEHY